MKNNFILSILCILLSYTSNAQNRSNIWHFGYNIELDFCSGTPSIGTGPIRTDEGCASLTNENCTWQFSTDGINVLVPDPPPFGTPRNVNNDLLGDPSSTSSAIIVPKPCDDSISYIFTVDYADGPSGIRFSVFDRTLNGGIGGVRPTEKNIFLAGISAERITAIKHANGKDYWVIAVTQGTNEFHRWLVTCQGVSNVRPIINTGPIITRSFGYVKASHCCDQLALAHKGDVFLYDFDNATGFINHTHTITLSTSQTMYGVEYTFDCNHLIATELGSNGGGGANIYRITDPCSSPNLTQTWFVNNAGGRYTLGAVQKGPDDVLYIAKDLETSLATIDPTGNVLNQTGILLQVGTQSTLGLPTLISGNVGEACTDLTKLPVKPSNLVTPPLETKGIEYVDVTNDGLYDIVTSNGNDIVYYKNNGSLGNPSFNLGTPNGTLYTVNTTPGNAFISFAMHELDLYVLYETPSLTIDHIAGTANPTTGGVASYSLVGTIITNAQLLYFDVADMDNDLDIDILGSFGSGHTTPINYYENISGVYTFSISNPILNVCFPTALVSAAFPMPELYDADCDGDFDLFLGIKENLLYYENTGSSTNMLLQDCNTLGSPCQTTQACRFQSADFGIVNLAADAEFIFPRFVDVNNDGKDDLYVTWHNCSHTPCSALQYYESQDCCRCPLELCFDYSPIPSGIYEADLLIKATGTIPAGNTVTFKADNKLYQSPFTVNGIFSDQMPGCSSCCGVNDPLVELNWLAPFVGDPNYSITQCSWNGECVFRITDYCIVSDGTTSYYDCEGNLICKTFMVGGTCSNSFSVSNCAILQAC